MGQPSKRNQQIRFEDDGAKEGEDSDIINVNDVDDENDK